MSKISRLMKSQFNSTYTQILNDLQYFGRTRIYLWRWLYNIFEDIYRDRGDLYPLLIKLLELEKYIYRAVDLHNLYYILGYYSGFMDSNITLKIIDKILTTYSSLIDLNERIKFLLLGIEISYLHGFLGEGNRFIEILSEELQGLDPLKQIHALSVLGYLISRVDIAYGESILREAINLREKLSLSERIIADAIIAFYLRRAIKGNIEAQRLLRESLRLIKEEDGLKKTFYLSCKVLPYVFGFAEIYGERLFDEMVRYFKDDFYFYNTILDSAIELTRIDFPKGAEEILYFIENKLGSSQLNIYERAYIYSKLAYSWSLIDGRRAKLVVPVVYHFISNSLKYIRSDRVISLLASSISFLAEVDIISAFQIFSELFQKINSYNKIAEVIIIVRNAFPKDVRGMLLRKMMKNTPKTLDDLIYATKAIYALRLSLKDVYLRKIMKVIDKLDIKDKIIGLIRLSREVYEFDSAYASQLKEYITELIESVDKDSLRAELLLYLAEQFVDIAPEDSKRYLASAINMLDHLEYDKAYAIYKKASEIVENIDEDYWAEQIKMMLRQEYKRIIKRKET